MGWAFVPLPGAVAGTLAGFCARVAGGWKTDNKGNPNPQAEQQHHITFLTPLSASQQRTLEGALGAEQPIAISLGEPFVERVFGESALATKQVRQRAREEFGMSARSVDRYLARNLAAGVLCQGGGLYWPARQEDSKK